MTVRLTACAILVTTIAHRAALAATATFAPVGPVTVPSGTSVQFDVTVAVESLAQFDGADIIIGSNTATDIGFTYSAAWTAAFANVTTPFFDTGFYAQDVFVGGNNATPVGASLLLGTITIDTTGMTPGAYQVKIDHTVDFDISALALQGTKDFLLGTATFNIACAVSAECDDGLFCNGTETCVAGICQSGTPPAVDDGVPCTIDACDETNDVVVHTPSDALCDNGVFCDGVETCHATLGCQSGPPADCTALDGQCVVGTCNAVTDLCEAVPANEGGACDDGVPCTQDVCQGGVCVGTNIAQITVQLEIDGLAPLTNVTRDVTFTITECPATVDTRVVPVTFSSGLGTAVLTNVNTAATWLSAREGHTLTRRAPVAFTTCTPTVDLTGAGALVSGDFQALATAQDGLVDIEDFGILAHNFGLPVTPGGADAATGADATGDGLQNADDFAVLQQNFFLTGDAADGCPGGAPGPIPAPSPRPDATPNAAPDATAEPRPNPTTKPRTPRGATATARPDTQPATTGGAIRR